MKAQQLIVAIAAGAMLLTAFAMLISGRAEANYVMTSVLVRVGLVLFTISLAWPTLVHLSGRIPVIVIAMVVGGIVIIAIRPRLLPIIAVLVVAGLAVHFILRGVSRRFDSRQ